jgi:hypothetical protein
MNMSFHQLMPNLRKGCLQDNLKKRIIKIIKNSNKYIEIYCKEPAKSTNINPIRC